MCIRDRTHSDTISFAQAKHLLDTEPDCLLFDVREEEEFITGHPVEAELFPLGTINEETAAERIHAKEDVYKRQDPERPHNARCR